MTTRTESQTRRAGLTRELIFEAALEIIDTHGLEALTMRRLAADLDASPMALYNHVQDKDALLAGVAELLLREIEMPTARDLDWADAIRAAARSFRGVLLAHPNALPVIEAKPATSPAAMRPIELSLSLLLRGGLGPENAVRAHCLLVGFIMGHVQFQCSNPLTDPETELAARRSSLPAEDFPSLMQVLPFMVGVDFDEAFEYGIDVILRGLRATLEDCN